LGNEVPSGGNVTVNVPVGWKFALGVLNKYSWHFTWMM